ncbi:MAG: glycosyltransferase family 9 protein [Acidisphaera sp.]|nr:glycosyltransferase family 9 protein [Acidisphaera sp.]
MIAEEGGSASTTSDSRILVRHFSGGRQRQRILVIKLDHFGDFITGLPALEQLRLAFPRDHIRLVCGPWNVALARECGLVDEVRSYTYFPENAIGWNGEPIESLEQFRTAASGHYDIAIDLRVDEDTRLLLAEVDASLRCGIGARGRFPFLDIILPPEHENRVNPAANAAAGTLIAPDRFRSQMPLRAPFFHETDFSVTDQYLLDGPNISLPRGRFRITYGLRSLGVPSLLGASVQIEVTRDGTHLVAREHLKRRRHLGMAAPSLEFATENEGSHYEFRLHTGGRAPGARLRFTGVWLEQLEEGGVPGIHSRLLPSELHVGEKLALLVSLVDERTRQLYTDRMLPEQPIADPDTAAALAAIPAQARRIVVAPLSNSRLRDWPLHRYAELVRRMLAELDCRVILIGSPAQAEPIARIVRDNGGDERILDLAGKTKWSDLPAILRQADLVICNNSGVAHLSAACGARTLALYSGSHQPQEWGPRGRDAHTIMAAVPCSPCGLDELESCPNGHRCMLEITPEFVMGQVMALLKPH